MAKHRAINNSLNTIAWGLIFIVWGATELFPSLPAGIGMLGVGMILLGINIFRLLKGLHVNHFSTTLGILALVWGALKLANSALQLPFTIPIFGALLVVLGVILITEEALERSKRHEPGKRKTEITP